MPVERLEKLLELQNVERDRQAKLAFAQAMAEAQSEMRVVVADKNNSQTKSRYASYAALDSAVRPIYTGHGFSVTFDTEDCEKADHLRIVAYVSCSGCERRYKLDMPCDGKGAKGGDVMTKTHAVMSATSYGKRGLLILIFNIPVADKWDDDGNAAGGEKPRPLITADQAEQLRAEMAERKVDEAKFCDFGEVERLEDIAADMFQAALAKVRMKPRASEAQHEKREAGNGK